MPGVDDATASARIMGPMGVISAGVIGVIGVSDMGSGDEVGLGLAGADPRGVVVALDSSFRRPAAIPPRRTALH